MLLAPAFLVLKESGSTRECGESDYFRQIIGKKEAHSTTPVLSLIRLDRLEAQVRSWVDNFKSSLKKQKGNLNESESNDKEEDSMDTADVRKGT